MKLLPVLVLVLSLCPVDLPAQRPSRRAADAAQRVKPPLMPWQRNLDDALALVSATGKPLLICVNMDGEVACDRLAWFRYRDPEFAALADGFVCLLASPDWHNTRDHDDLGRRIPDSRFGRVLDPEHIDIEPLLYERYFDGRRTAPRHVGIDAQGKVLFDIFLTQGLGPIDAALATHGKPVPAQALDEAGLLDSPDAGHRDRLAALFASGDEAVRQRLVRAALTPSRRVQHPDLLRLGFRDPSVAVRAAAVANLVAHLERAPIALVPDAFAACEDVAAGQALVDALHALAGSDAEAASRAGYLARVYGGLLLDSRVVDVARWRHALALGPRIQESALAPDELDALDARLNALERELAVRPDDRALRLLIARATMRYARIRLTQGQDPTFLLHDVNTAARRATSVAAPDGRALGYLAWASALLDEPETPALAVDALSHLLSHATSPLSAEVLAIFARVRTRALYRAIGDGAVWPAMWIAEIQACYHVLLEHPACRLEHAVAAVEWLGVLEARRQQGEAVRRAVRRFPGSAELHGMLRQQTLRDVGSRSLEAFYTAVDVPAEDRPAWAWYAGLASLFAAENDAHNRDAMAALDSYARSSARFETARASTVEFDDSSRHYLCLAAAGRARLLLERGELAEADRAIQAGLRARPASASDKDGFGNTPRSTAALVLEALQRGDDDVRVQALKTLLEELGIVLY